MSGNITIVEAALADADAVGEVHAASWTVAYAAFFAPEFFAAAVEERRTKWHTILAENTGTALLALLDGRPSAYSYSAPVDDRPGCAEILGFYAHPDFWGSGIAAALMDATLTRLREDGFEQVCLWTLSDTAQSRRFYAKHGFVESGTRAHDFGDGNLIDQVEYERSLRP